MNVTSADGVEVAVHDLGGDGPPLVLVHATGFHGLVLAPLGRRLHGDFRCFSLDQRGHGDSRIPAGHDLDWHALAADVLAAVDGLDLHRPFAFGHSSGGTAVLMAEQARPGTFAALYCYEPVLVAADPPLGRDGGNWLAEQARRRRTTFASREEALRHYRSRPPLETLDGDVLRAYVDHGFEDTVDGRVRLKCLPDHEAAVYETATAHDAYTRLGDVTCAVAVARGSESDLPPPDTGALPDPHVAILDGLGHLGPLERPGQVAASMLAFFAGCEP